MIQEYTVLDVADNSGAKKKSDASRSSAVRAAATAPSAM
jgi:ribosomal protein L14